MGFWRRFFGFEKKKQKLLTHLNPDLEESKKLQEAFKKIQSLEAQISDIKIKDKKKDEEKKDFLDELILIKEIKKKSDKFEGEIFENHFELSILFKMVKDKKRKIEITDRDNKKVFDRFRSFVFLNDGINFGIKGESGRIWAYGPTLNHLIYKPESIKNYIRQKRLPIPYDSEHRPLPDLDKMKMREIKYIPEEDAFVESDELLRPVRDMIMERDRSIFKKGEQIEYLEKLNTLQNSKMIRYQRNLNLSKEKAGLNDTELSIAIEGMTQYARQFGGVARQNLLLMEGKLNLDEIKERQDRVISSLLEELEDDKSKNAVRRALDELQKDFQFADKYGRRTIINDTPEGFIPVKSDSPLKQPQFK